MAISLALLQLLAISLSAGELTWAPLIRGLLANILFFWVLLQPGRMLGRTAQQVLTPILVVVISALINTHIVLNGALPLLQFATLADDSSFLAALLRQPALYAWLAAAAAAMWMATRLSGAVRLAPGKFLTVSTATCVVLFLVVTLLFPTPTFSRWYARNVVEFNLPLRDRAPAQLSLRDGRPLVDSRVEAQLFTSPQVRQVVLIMIEGLSQAHVDAGWLPRVKALESRGLVARRFLNHQRQTNRGLYSLFCGAYPNLVSSVAKADLMALSGLEQACLPQLLETNGVATAFIQSANLNYMSKDLFAEAVGFSVIKGQKDIMAPEFKGKWGVDDRSLLREGARFLAAAPSGQQQFLAMLTTGTHPPFIVPGGLQGREEAFRFADAAVAQFIAGLEQTGELANTVVIVSSDESATGSLPGASDLPPDNLGYLLAIGGGLPAINLEGLRGQVDIPATVAQLLGQQWPHSGVSLMQQPAADRTLYAANSFKREVYEVDANSVVRCNAALQCEQPQTEPGLRNLVAMNDIADAGDGMVLARIQDRSYNTREDDLVIGRFITNRPRGSSILATFDIDTSASSARAEDKRVRFVGWDCDERLGENVAVNFAVPGGQKNFQGAFWFPQKFRNQCYKLRVQDEGESTSSSWRLNEWRMERVVQEEATIATIARQNRTPTRLPRIAHAGGGLGTLSYTNSIAALDQNYRLGFRLFEMDFIFTADGQLVCGHDWDVAVEQNHGFRYEQAPTLAQFERDFADRKYPPCTVPQLAAWFREHPDAQLVTDIKDGNIEGLKALKQSMPNQLDQVIPQIYQPKEYAQARELGFQHIIFTLYRYAGTTTDLLQAIEDKPLFAVTMPIVRAADGLAVLLGSLGIATYTHTVNDSGRWSALRDYWAVDEIYTDFIAPTSSRLSAVPG